MMQNERITGEMERARRAHRQADLAGAESAYRRALVHCPDHGGALAGLGACLAQGGRTAEALGVLKRALENTAGLDRCLVLANLGNAWQQAGRPEQAREALDQALAELPATATAIFVELLLNHGNVLRELARPREAAASYERALLCDPRHVRALVARAVLHQDEGRAQAALEDLDRALGLAPDDGSAQYNRAVVLQSLQRWEASAKAYAALLERQPAHVPSLRNLGIVLRAMGKSDEARCVADRWLQCEPQEAAAHVARAHALQELDRIENAEESYSAALALDPSRAAALIGRADCRRMLGRYADAIADYESLFLVEVYHPDAAKAHFNAAVCHLLLGNLEAGWPHFEWRWGDAAIHPPHRHGIERLWLGEGDLAGRTILVHAEQGYGDSLQMCRYVPELARRGASVRIEAPPALHALLAALEGVVSVCSRDDPAPPFDWHVPMMSLPLAFRTQLADLPARAPYLVAPAASRAAWRARLQSAARPRIGFVWAGNPAHGNDANRSIPEGLLPEFLQSLDRNGATLVSLQREVSAQAASTLARRAIPEYGSKLVDFADAAGLLAELDLLVSVDTAMAHLAGALGVPVWILLPQVPDWRWLLHRADSPWYPSARLFRQAMASDWAGVFAGVEQSLVQRFAGHAGG